MAYIKVKIDGVCECLSCCRRVWTSTYDCGLAAWGTPTLASSVLQGGSCPSNVGWAYTSGCNARYIQYTATLSLCDDCADLAPTPPTGPVLAAPSGCCANCCSFYWTCTYDCAIPDWNAPLLVLTTDGVPCAADTGWVATGDPCIRAQIIYQLRELGVCPTEISPFPPVSPPVDCCPVCCTPATSYAGKTMTMTTIIKSSGPGSTQEWSELTFVGTHTGGGVFTGTETYTVFKYPTGAAPSSCAFRAWVDDDLPPPDDRSYTFSCTIVGGVLVYGLNGGTGAYADSLLPNAGYPVGCQPDGGHLNNPSNTTASATYTSDCFSLSEVTSLCVLNYAMIDTGCGGTASAQLTTTNTTIVIA